MTLIITDDGGGAIGVDGDLHGIVPERQALPAAPHIVVDGTSVTTSQDWTSGSTVLLQGEYTANSPTNAIALAGRMAQFVQDELNPGLDETVRFGLLPTEGSPCLIHVMPGDYSGTSGINFNDNTLNFGLLSNNHRITWVRGWLNGLPPSPEVNGRVVRDIAFLGMGANPSDVLFPRIEFKFSPAQGVYDGQVDNVRFQNVRVQNSGQRETIFGGQNMIGNMDDHPNADGVVAGSRGQSVFVTTRDPQSGDGVFGDVWRNTTSDQFWYREGTVETSAWVNKGTFSTRFPRDKYQGVIKLYDCEIKGEENTQDYMGCGQKQAIRMQAYCNGLDLRNVTFFAAQEHSCYTDNVQGFLYMVDCRQSTVPHICPPDFGDGNGGLIGSTQRVANGNTFLQLASRLIKHPGHHPDHNAVVAMIRCDMQGNLTTHGIGGYDITCWGGFDGTFYVIDCSIQGSAIPWGPDGNPGFSTNNSRGGINFTQETGWDADGTPEIAKGATVFETAPGSGVWYSTRKLVVRGLNFDTWGNRRSTNNLRCCKEIEYGFTQFRSSDYKAQFQFNGDQEHGSGAVPYRPNLSFAWGPEMSEGGADPSDSPPFLAGDGSGPFNGSASVKVEHRSTSDSTDRVSLSDAQIDAYDGSDPS